MLSTDCRPLLRVAHPSGRRPAQIATEEGLNFFLPERLAAPVAAVSCASCGATLPTAEATTTDAGHLCPECAPLLPCRARRRKGARR